MAVDNISHTFQLIMTFFVHAANEPELADFTFMENERKGIKVEIIERVQANWVELADHFRLPSQTVNNIKAQTGVTPAEACREVFKRWLVAESNPKLPKTWETLIKVMRRIGDDKLAEEITDILTG